MGVCVGVCACVVCVSVNRIGAAGCTAVAEALKVNTSVLKIDLRGEWCWRCLPSVHVAAVRLTEYVCVFLYACVVYVSANRIGDAGVTAVAEALKVNTSVQKIHLFSEWCAGGACQVCMW